MEYKIITPEDSKYPQKIKERLIDEILPSIYYYGPLEFLEHFTMAVVCSDESAGTVLMETNQLLFTIREYEMNLIGSWHSVIETEIFRLGLYRKNTTVTLFSAKGLGKEDYESYLLDRFYPPIGDFPEKDEYYRRANDGELLILSVSNPEETRHLRKNIMQRNWIACVLGDIVFIPYGPKGTKTYITAKKVVEAKIPVFTLEHSISVDLHKLGIPGFSRKTVKNFLEEKGAKIATKKDERCNSILNYETSEHKVVIIKEPSQIEMEFEEKQRRE